MNDKESNTYKFDILTMYIYQLILIIVIFNISNRDYYFCYLYLRLLFYYTNTIFDQISLLNFSYISVMLLLLYVEIPRIFLFWNYSSFLNGIFFLEKLYKVLIIKFYFCNLERYLLKEHAPETYSKICQTS